MNATRLSRPYITPDSGQVRVLPLIFVDSPEAGGWRLSYLDETPKDRMFGALWVRHDVEPSSDPDAKVLRQLVNPLLQRSCMLNRLCRVCGQSAADDSGRTWWLSPHAPTTGFTANPPTCRACIPRALDECPHLRLGDPVVFTVGEYWPAAVIGTVYVQTYAGLAIQAHRNASIPLDAFRRMDSVLAEQLIVESDDFRMEVSP